MFPKTCQNVIHQKMSCRKFVVTFACGPDQKCAQMDVPRQNFKEQYDCHGNLLQKNVLFVAVHRVAWHPPPTLKNSLGCMGLRLFASVQVDCCLHG
jgi:hypothetical protein